MGVKEEVALQTQLQDTSGTLRVNVQPTDAAGLCKCEHGQQMRNEVKSLSVSWKTSFFFKRTNPAWTFVSYLFCDWLWMDAGDRGHRRHHKRKDCHRKGKQLTKGSHTDYRQQLHRKPKDLNVSLSDTMWDYTWTGRLWAWCSPGDGFKGCPAWTAAGSEGGGCWLSSCCLSPGWITTVSLVLSLKDHKTLVILQHTFFFYFFMPDFAVVWSDCLCRNKL